MAKKKHSPRIHPQLIEEISDWPIYRLHDDRRNFIKEIDAFIFENLRAKYKGNLRDLLQKTLYQERIRMTEEPWKVDPADERTFWKKIQQELVQAEQDRNPEQVQALYEGMLKAIIHRYSEEIVGTFRIKTFLFARRFLTLFFSRLLKAASTKSWQHLFNPRQKLYERLLAEGDLARIRKLMDKGSVVVVSTHSSNLDSILVGYVMDAVLGLPSFLYGAGLNLYNTGYTAYFMNRIGAYRVDRRKKNPIYLDVLTGMTNLSLQRGTNNLFFPGGTRSRSGELERYLKKGLLGSTVEAQRALLQAGKTEKVFIVPVVLCYHVVLEAKFLIEQHLSRTGKENYIRSRDNFFSTWQILKFVWRLFSKNSKITVSFGKPMDVLGNFVDDQGRSFDRFGQEVDIKEYFMSDGSVNKDEQREREYTKILSDRIVDRYFKDNVVLSSHLVAYVAFRLLRRYSPGLDLYALLRTPTEDTVFDQQQMLIYLQKAQEFLTVLEEKGRVKLSEEIRWPADKLLRHGVKNLGVFHPKKPLVFNKKKELISQEFKLLYFYHNRLEHYGLEQIFQAVPTGLVKDGASVK